MDVSKLLEMRNAKCEENEEGYQESQSTKPIVKRHNVKRHSK